MSAKAVELMRAIHGENIYLGYGSALPLDLKGWNSTPCAIERTNT